MRKGKKHILSVMILLLVFGTWFAGGSMAVYGKKRSSDNQVHLEQVHTLYWRAVLRRSVKSGRKVLAKRGRRVTVVDRGRRYSTIVCGKPRRRVRVRSSWLSFRGDLTTIRKKGDYNTATKEAYINKRTHVKKKEKYLVWVSLDKQRVNIFRSSGGRWKLKNVFKCSTGKAGTPTRTGWHKVDYKRTNLLGMKWYTEVSGGGMHKWPGKLKKSLYGKHVASHGCIRLSRKNARKVYNMIPVGTRVLVY